MIFRIFLLLLAVPCFSWARTPVKIHVGIGASFGGDALLRYKSSSCSLIEKSFGCREGTNTTRAGEAWELMLGATYNLPGGVGVRLSRSIGDGGGSDGEWGSYDFNQPHTDLAFQWREKDHGWALGASWYSGTELDLRKWTIPNPFNANMIKFKDALGGFVEFRIKQNEHVSTLIRLGYVEHVIESIDGISVQNGAMYKGDYGALILVYEL